MQNFLVAIEPADGDYWWYKCTQCGNERSKHNKHNVRNGHTRSCGCMHHPTGLDNPNAHDKPAGTRFGLLTVISWHTEHSLKALVRCDCGKEALVNRCSIVRGLQKSCGCRKGRFLPRVPGMYGTNGKPTAEYVAWCSMKQRCVDPNHKGWIHYGGRGIKVCPEWISDFPAFLAHVGQKPSPGHVLDRIDNDGNYEPGNVRWSNRSVSARNRRFVKLNARSVRAILRSSKSDAELATRHGVSRAHVYRVRRRMTWRDITAA
jgi:hypothetical protein